VSEWQPIETAPFGPDGYTRLLVCEEGEVHILHHEDPRLGGRYEWHDGSGDSFQDYRPTHWMLLPKPPTSVGR
jgi:hypothetical protein